MSIRPLQVGIKRRSCPGLPLSGLFLLISGAAFLVLLCPIHQAQAAGTTYYVDNSCLKNGDGSSRSCASSAGQPGPFNSIANMQAKRGGYSGDDKILLRKGQTFREQLAVPSSGTTGHSITFGAYGAGALPIITGFNVLTGFIALSPNAYKLTGVTTQPKVVAHNGTLLKYNHVGAAIGAREWDWASNVLYINVGEDPSGGTVEAGARDFNITTLHKGFITIDGIAMTGANVASVYLNTSTNNWIIQHSTIYNTLAGIQAASDVGSTNTIQDNTIHDTVEFGIVWNGGRGSTGHSFQRNTIYNVGGKGGRYTNMSGIYARAGSGTIVQNNIIHDCGDTVADHGIYLSGDNVVIRYNTIYHIAGYGVKVSYGSTYVEVSYNLMYSVNGGVITDVGTPSYIGIYNNTIANSGVSGIGLRASTGDHIKWKNNIVYNMNYLKDGAGTEYNLYVADGVTNLTSDHNVVYSPAATSYYASVGGTGKTWAQWQALGFDAHSLNVDPQFVNATGNDFHLLPTSPAINAGTNVGLTLDYAGTSVPRGAAPDIGAYQFGAPSLRAPIGLRIIK